MRLCLLLCSMVLLGSCPVLAADQLVVYTVNYPLQYFAQRIGGEQVSVHFPAPADVDPAFWQPDADTIGRYQRADLILLNGAGYAKWVNKVSLPRLKQVDTSRGFRDQHIEISTGLSHSHGPGGEHSHAGTVSTTWLDPVLAAQQAEAIRDALSKQRPDRSREFSENYAVLRAELEALDKALGEVVAKQPGQPLLASHPVYQYLARRYGLNLESVQLEPGVVPTESQWQTLKELTLRHPARWMLWEGRPERETVERLQNLMVQSIVFEPCANVPDEGDYMSVMQENLTNLQTAFPEFSIR